MKKAHVLSVLAGALTLALVCGCAGLQKGPTDEEQIAALISGWRDAMLAQDIDKIMVAFSENFTHSEAPDKAALKDFLQSAIDMGYIEGAEIAIDEAKTTIEGTTATVYPIALRSAAGEVTLELTLTKEEAGWLITTMDIEGI